MATACVPQRKASLGHPVAVLLVLGGLMSVAGAAMAANPPAAVPNAAAAPIDVTDVPSRLAEELFKNFKFSGRIAVWPVDAAQAKQAGLTPAQAAVLSDQVRAAIHKVGVARHFTLVEREAISKVFQEQQFSQGLKESDFEKLAREANADALVLVSLQRKDRETVVLSARVVRSKGPAVGQIVAATKSYDAALPEDVAETEPPPMVNGRPRNDIMSDSVPVPPPDTVTPQVVTPRPYYAPQAYTYRTTYYYAASPAYYYYRAPAPRAVFYAAGPRRRWR